MGNSKSKNQAKKESLSYLLDILGTDTMIIGRNNKDIYYYVENVEVIDSNGTSYVNEDPSTGTYQFKEKAVFKVFALLGMIFGIVN